MTTEEFTQSERDLLLAYFTNTDRPVFALRNLPEVVKGALFARYSRSSKSLRRLFLDEFAGEGDMWSMHSMQPQGRSQRADELYDTVLGRYGDDSVAQLGFAHVAIEGASNILTKIIEWGRLMAYLEQSTRYVPYNKKPYRYYAPSLQPELRALYHVGMAKMFDQYNDAFTHVKLFLDSQSDDSSAPAIRARRSAALDAVRGALPAATTSNLGACGSGQAWEALIIRMMASDLPEANDTAHAILRELRGIIPAFLTRVDKPDRGVRHMAYLADIRRSMEQASEFRWGAYADPPGTSVQLVDFDTDGEDKVVAAMLYPYMRRPYDQILGRAATLETDERAAVVKAYMGNRMNRREKPGRALEESHYTFDILGEYKIFRDLQRHRMLTMEWQPLTTMHGWIMPDLVLEAGASAREAFVTAMEVSSDLYDRLVDEAPEYASYAAAFGYRIRFRMTLNAREAMHMIELRTGPNGDPAYRQVCQEMHRLIREQAGHAMLADAMQFVDHNDYREGRLFAEQKSSEGIILPGA